MSHATVLSCCRCCALHNKAEQVPTSRNGLLITQETSCVWKVTLTSPSQYAVCGVPLQAGENIFPAKETGVRRPLAQVQRAHEWQSPQCPRALASLRAACDPPVKSSRALCKPHPLSQVSSCPERERSRQRPLWGPQQGDVPPGESGGQGGAVPRATLWPPSDLWAAGCVCFGS